MYKYYLYVGIYYICNILMFDRILMILNYEEFDLYNYNLIMILCYEEFYLYNYIW